MCAHRTKVLLLAGFLVGSALLAAKGGKTGVLEAPLDLFQAPLQKIPDSDQHGENVFTEENLTPQDIEQTAIELSEKIDPQEKLFTGIDACSAGLVRIALLQGANSSKPKNGYHALSYLIHRPGFCGAGRAHLVRSLLNGGAQIDETDKANGFSALHYAAQQRDADMCRLLVQMGADPSQLSDREIDGKRVSAIDLGGEEMKSVLQP